MSAAGPLAVLREVARGQMDATVRLYTGTESHGPGVRPLIVWTPGLQQPGKLIPAEAGGQNMKADQPTPVGDYVLTLVEGATVHEGQRATVEGEDRLQQPWRMAVLIKKVVHPNARSVVQRCFVTEIEGWWPT